MNNNAAILDQQPATSNQNSVLVSIIIPAYNTANYIHKAIESSQRQTHSNVEIIIIDDGSTDDTLKVSQSYAEKDSRIRVIHQENAGVSSARNHGMREANGEYYVFLDSDDWFEDDAVEVLLDAQMKHPDKLIAAAYYDVINDVRVKPFVRGSNKNFCCFNVDDAVRSFSMAFRKGISIMTFHSLWSKIFRADISRKIKFHEGIAYSEDAVFVLEYLHEAGEALYIDEYLMYHYYRSDSATLSAQKESMRKNFHSQAEAHNIMINNPSNSSETKETLEIIACSCIMDFITNSALSISENREAKRYVKQYAHKFLMCREISLIKKLTLLYKVYLPVSVSKFIWQIEKKIRDTIRKRK